MLACLIAVLVVMFYLNGDASSRENLSFVNVSKPPLFTGLPNSVPHPAFYNSNPLPNGPQPVNPMFGPSGKFPVPEPSFASSYTAADAYGILGKEQVKEGFELLPYSLRKAMK